MQSEPYETLTHKKRKERRVKGGEEKRIRRRSRKKRKSRPKKRRSRIEFRFWGLVASIFYPVNHLTGLLRVWGVIVVVVFMEWIKCLCKPEDLSSDTTPNIQKPCEMVRACSPSPCWRADPGRFLKFFSLPV